MPGVSTAINGLRSWQIYVTNEQLHLLNYDNEPCMTNVTYDWYQCKHEYIQLRSHETAAGPVYEAK